MNKMYDLIAREPVAAGDILKVAAWLLAGMVMAGMVSSGQEAEISALAATIAPVMAMIVNVALAVWQRRLVTPLADPRDDDGNRLYADEVIVP